MIYLCVLKNVNFHYINNYLYSFHSSYSTYRVKYLNVTLKGIFCDDSRSNINPYMVKGILNGSGSLLQKLSSSFKINTFDTTSINSNENMDGIQSEKSLLKRLYNQSIHKGNILRLPSLHVAQRI